MLCRKLTFAFGKNRDTIKKVEFRYEDLAAVIVESVAQFGKFGAELDELLGNLELEIGQGLADVEHEDLNRKRKLFSLPPVKNAKRTRLRRCDRKGVPQNLAFLAYAGWFSKKLRSYSRATLMSFLDSMSF